MTENYGRDLDLNLLRVFVVVADTGSVTKAAARLYLTQPAISASLRRLRSAVGAPLFVKHGRGIVLSTKGAQLVAAVRPHLQALVDAALSAPAFEPATTDRIVRLGVSGASELWLLPVLLRALADRAPRMRLIAIPVQFRTVGEMLVARTVDLAVTVADDLPPAIGRTALAPGRFVCLYDPRHGKLGKKISMRDYFARDHVIVSYNADLRGIVEDVVGRQRRVRCSLSSFAHVGDVVDDSDLLATVPISVATHVTRVRPHLRIAQLPFRLASSVGPELLWPASLDDDPAIRFVREQIVALAAVTPSGRSRSRP